MIHSPETEYSLMSLDIIDMTNTILFDDDYCPAS